MAWGCRRGKEEGTAQRSCRRATDHTRESIESLFINHSSAIPRLVKYLSYVVIDEIHALVGRERGTHLRSLLYRLRRNTSQPISNGRAVSNTRRFLRRVQGMDVSGAARVGSTIITDQNEKKRILYRIHAYALSGEASAEDDSEDETAGIVEEMYEHLVGQKNLLFANRKQDVEWFADSLNRRCQELGTSQGVPGASRIFE